MPGLALDSGFATTQVTHTFVALDADAATVRTEHTFDLEALRNERFFVREYTWVSKEGIEKAPVIHSGTENNGIRSHHLQGPVLEGADSSRLALIDLGRVLAAGEHETVQIEHFFVCTDPQDPGFVGHLVRSGCNKVTLRAVLPHGLGHRVTHRAWKSGAERSYRDDLLTPHETGDLMVPLRNAEKWREYIVTIPDPVAGERHRIVWDLH